MKRGRGWPSWRVAAVSVQLAVVAACGVVGWQLTHPGGGGPPLVVRRPLESPPPVPSLTPAPPRLPARVANTGGPPGVAALVARVDRDDLRLYRGQWQTIQVLAAGVRGYLTSRVLPLVQAAARGEWR